MIYDLADLRVLIRNEYPFTTRFCEKYLSEDQESPYDLIAAPDPEDFENEQKASAGYSLGYIENICIYRNLCLQLPSLNRMLLHAAILEADGAGYAFLGRSGTGKSTHTGLWLENVEGSYIVNGDKPVLFFDEKEVYAYGTPWMGKEGRGCKAKTPLKALVFLEQAKENTIRRLSPSETAMRLFSQILLPSDEKNADKTLMLADELVKRVPTWVLGCTISEEAVKTCYTAITGKKYQKKQ
ncbi:MAG: hypothetical protein IJX81_01575 [Clostridia bacterium]|nr:hypothetical protein [Clostridia bacterium]